MQLGQTVAIRVLDDHHGSIGHVDAHFNHRGGDQNLQLSRRKIRQRRLLFGGRLSAVGQPHRKPGEGLPAQLPGVAFDRHEAVGVLAFLHQRADDIGLPPGLQFLTDKGVQAAALAFRHQPGLDRLTARGQFIDHTHIQIAEQTQRQRTRNRRGGHDQQVRRAPGGRIAAFFQKGRALGHAEAMLLVRNAQAQMLKTHAAADQGVSADHRLPSALPNGLQRFPPFLRGHAADQQAAAEAVFFEKGFHGFHMLPGQDLRGSHQGALIAALSGQQHRAHGNSRFAAAHVPLHHPGHGIGGRAFHSHIPGDLRKGTALRARR